MLEFTDQPLVQEGSSKKGSVVEQFKELYAGAGENRLICNQEGFSIGASSFTNAPFSVDWNGNVIATSLVVTGGTIKAGQTAYDTGTGYWIGTVGGTPKFSLGNSAGNKLTWNGTTLSLTGSITIQGGSGLANLSDAGALALLNTVGSGNCDTTIISGGKIITGLLTADNIQAGTLIGRTVKATGGAGVDVWMSSSTGALEFRYGSSQKGYMAADTSGNVKIQADTDLLLNPTGSCYIDSGSSIALIADAQASIEYNDNGGSDSFFLVSNGSTAMQVDSSLNMATAGYIQCGTTFKSSDGTSGTDSTAKGFITSIRASGGNLEAKFREITHKDGLLTVMGSESGWINMGAY